MILQTTDVEKLPVMVVCAGQIHSALHVRKVHPYRLNAFSSDETGAIGCIEEASVRWFNQPNQSNSKNQKPQQQNEFCSALDFLGWATKNTHFPQVEVIHHHVGNEGKIVQALLAQGTVSGIVVVATGNGTLGDALLSALKSAQQQGVFVWKSTRCEQGKLVGQEQSIFGDSFGLSPNKARIGLMLSLIVTSKMQTIKNI